MARASKCWTCVVASAAFFATDALVDPVDQEVSFVSHPEVHLSNVFVRVAIVDDRDAMRLFSGRAEEGSHVAAELKVSTDQVVQFVHSILFLVSRGKDILPRN